ncbi:MAG: hypothetical protein AAFX40_10275 [Cyanobacteria bacterium J06639_1]
MIHEPDFSTEVFSRLGFADRQALSHFSSRLWNATLADALPQGVRFAVERPV